MKNLMRRGMLGKLAAAAVAGPSVARNLMASGGAVMPLGRSVPAFVGEGLSSQASVAQVEPPPKHLIEKFQAAMEAHNRARQRAHIARDLMGGFPPGLQGNHSWAPWFRAQAAARRLEADVWEDRSFVERLHSDIFGAARDMLW